MSPAQNSIWILLHVSEAVNYVHLAFFEGEHDTLMCFS